MAGRRWRRWTPGAEPAGPPAAPFDAGTLMGKRYVTEDESLELLCTKPGAGSLAARRRTAERQGRQAAPVLRLRSAVHLGMILEMAADGLGRPGRRRLPRRRASPSRSSAQRARRARHAAGRAAGDHVVLVDENSAAVPIALFGAAIAGKPFVPVNYRLADDRLRAIVERTAPAVVVAGAGVADAARRDRRHRGRRAGRVPRRGRRRAPVAGDRRLGVRPRRHRRAPLHQRHHRRAEGGRPAAPEPGVVHRQLASSSAAPARTRPPS